MSDQNFNLKDTVNYDLKKLQNYKNIVLICDKETKKRLKNIPVLVSKNPRLDFSRVMMKFFVNDEFKPGCIEIIGTDKDNSSCGHCDPPIKAGEFVFQYYNLDSNGKLTKYREHFQTQ